MNKACLVRLTRFCFSTNRKDSGTPKMKTCVMFQTLMFHFSLSCVRNSFYNCSSGVSAGRCSRIKVEVEQKEFREQIKRKRKRGGIWKSVPSKIHNSSSISPISLCCTIIDLDVRFGTTSLFLSTWRKWIKNQSNVLISWGFYVPDAFIHTLKWKPEHVWTECGSFEFWYPHPHRTISIELQNAAKQPMKFNAAKFDTTLSILQI